jgi:hypothetical protein
MGTLSKHETKPLLYRGGGLQTCTLCLLIASSSIVGLGLGVGQEINVRINVIFECALIPHCTPLFNPHDSHSRT